MKGVCMRPDAAPRRHFPVLAAIAALLVAGCATPKTAPRIFFPFWSVRDSKSHTVGCAEVVVWISKSGKEGLGANIRVRAPNEPCPIAIAEAVVELGSERVEAALLPPEGTLPAASNAKAYIPFPFDNEAAWNRGDHQATLVVRIRAGGVSREIRQPLTQRPLSFLREPPPPAPRGVTVDKVDLKPLRPPGSTKILAPPPEPVPPAPQSPPALAPAPTPPAPVPEPAPMPAEPAAPVTPDDDVAVEGSEP